MNIICYMLVRSVRLEKKLQIKISRLSQKVLSLLHPKKYILFLSKDHHLITQQESQLTVPYGRFFPKNVPYFYVEGPTWRYLPKDDKESQCFPKFHCQ